MNLLKEVNIGNIEVLLKGSLNKEEHIDFGALEFECEGREFILDVLQSYTEYPEELGENKTRITLDLEVDQDTFPDCKYDLTPKDLLESDHNNLVRELYVGGDFKNDIVSITLFFEVEGVDYEMKLNEEGV